MDFLPTSLCKVAKHVLASGKPTPLSPPTLPSKAENHLVPKSQLLRPSPTIPGLPQFVPVLLALLLFNSEHGQKWPGCSQGCECLAGALSCSQTTVHLSSTGSNLLGSVPPLLSAFSQSQGDPPWGSWEEFVLPRSFAQAVCCQVIFRFLGKHELITVCVRNNSYIFASVLSTSTKWLVDEAIFA